MCNILKKLLDIQIIANFNFVIFWKTKLKNKVTLKTKWQL